MESFWPGIATELSEPGGMTVTTAPGITESDALCRCLVAIDPPLLRVLADGLSVAADIGGGSTDIGIRNSARYWIRCPLSSRGTNYSPASAGLPCLPPG